MARAEQGEIMRFLTSSRKHDKVLSNYMYVHFDQIARSDP